MSTDGQPDRIPDTIEELLKRWAQTDVPGGAAESKGALPIVRITRPVPGRRYVVDANKAAAGSDASQAGSSLVNPKHAPILCANVYWTVILAGRRDAEIAVEFMPVFDAPSGRVSGGKFTVGGSQPFIHAGVVQTPFDRPDSPVGKGSALTFVLHDPPVGVVVEELLVFLGDYTY